MSLRDTHNSYGIISRLNHWLGAAVVIALLAIGLYFHELPRGDQRSYWLALHISIGALAFLFIAFRLIWRGASRSPAAAEQAPALQKLSKLIHVLLLLGIAIMFISGPLTIWSADRAINAFGLFSIPSPLGEMHDLHEALEEVHEFVSRGLLVLIVIHVLAALKHAITHPAVLRGRMWGRSD